jgi:hypothetical protein
VTEKKMPKRFRRHRIKDARGRRVTQLDPVALHLLRRHDVIEADVLRAIVHEKGVRIGGKERASLIVGVVGLLTIGGFFIRSLLVESFGAAPYARSSAVVYFALMPWCVWMYVKRSRVGKIAAAMLKYCRCPHCGYDLRMLPVDLEDGATLCPECGCAWRLENAGSAGDRSDG